MIRIRADLDQGKKVLLICGFRSGSSADRSVLGLIPKQMEWGSLTEMEHARDRFLMWVGNQMTVQRIWGLAHFRHCDPNSFTRMA